ncbi:MAG TPA: helix-turn-helix domain-containing protein [Thermomicrobiales bacterium]|nr:helix-turn-helix domain-containing protein [Thermomicrobiales bacterium]
MKSLDEMQAERPVNRERVEELKREMLAQTRGYRLREMREALGMSPDYLANKMQVSTLQIEQIENGDIEQLPISVIRAYVEAVGWELQVEIDLGDTRYRIA